MTTLHPPSDPSDNSALGVEGPAKPAKKGDGVPARADVACAIVFIGIALYVLYETASYPPSIVAGAPGPALFPRVLAGCLILLSVILIFEARRKKKEDASLKTTSRAGTVKAGLAGVFLAGFVLLAEHVDFFLLMMLLLVLVITVAGEKRLHVVFLVPALFVAFLYVVFFRIFGVMFQTFLF